MDGTAITDTTPALDLLKLFASRIEGMRSDQQTLIEISERFASHLLAGGELYTPSIARWFPHEFGGRAGGLMGIRSQDHAGPLFPTANRDIAYVALPTRWTDDSRNHWVELLHSSGRIIAVGSPDQLEKPTDRVEAFTTLGSPPPPSTANPAAVTPFEQIVRGWLVVGEMVAACTRAGRMPHIWMSVWLEGAMVRNAAFYRHNNLREPWQIPTFHENIYIPPLPSGYVAGEFLRELEGIRAILAAQSKSLARAGEWMASAHKQGRRISMVAVGHSYPEILSIADPRLYQVAWSKSISHVARAHPADLSSGDVAIHLGYSPVDSADVRALLDRDVRFIYTSPYGRRELPDHENLIWLDLPWRPGDATVDVPGYSVRILPMSSSAHTMAYFSLLAELASHR